MIKRIDFSRETPESRRIYVNQWDYGLILHITGIQAKEAHFAIEGSSDNALVVPLAEEGGILSANVPDRFLAQEREIYAYLYEETGEDGRTVGKVTIHVKPRAKPEDYIYTPEELKRYEVLEADIAGIKEEISQKDIIPLEKLVDYGVELKIVTTITQVRCPTTFVSPNAIIKWNSGNKMAISFAFIGSSKNVGHMISVNKNTDVYFALTNTGEGIMLCIDGDSTYFKYDEEGDFSTDNVERYYNVKTTNCLNIANKNSADSEYKPQDGSDLSTKKYVDDSIAGMTIERVDMSDVPPDGGTVYTIEPNKLYVFPEMANLALDFAEPENAGIANEYHVIFTSGDTATKLILPEGVLTDLAVESRKVYELSVLEKCLAYQNWEVSV